MNIKESSVVQNPVTGDVHCVLTAVIDRAAILSHVALLTGDDGLGDPSDNKGLQQVVYKDGTFEIVSYQDALHALSVQPNAVTMIAVSALRTALRQALN